MITDPPSVITPSVVTSPSFIPTPTTTSSGSRVDAGLQLCTATDFLVSPRIVFKADFTLEKIQATCSFSHDVLHSRSGFDSICLRDNALNCCPDISLGNVISAWRNVSSCAALRQSDVDAVKERLSECAPWYGDDLLTITCTEAKCLDAVPPSCRLDAVYVYIILHYLVDVDFVDALVDKSQSTFPSLTYAMVLYQTLDSSAQNEDEDERRFAQDWYIDLYEDVLSERDYAYDGVAVAGYSFGISFRIFSRRIVAEGVYPALSLVVIFVIIWIYTQSFFITSMGCLAIVFAVVNAYFLYHVVFRVPFFSFLNVLSLVIAIGIGADDIFVYLDVWRHTTSTNPNASLTSRVRTTLKHAALAMFVTSFTTASAFYANVVSSITAIRIFGVFAGTTIVVNYVMMITWLPAVVVIHEKYFDGCCRRRRCCVRGDSSSPGRLRRFFRRVKTVLNGVYGTAIPCLVTSSIRYVFLFVFAALAIAASVAVFYEPRLRLPSDGDVQFFVASEPLATYDLELSDKFRFEISSDPSANTDSRLPLTFVWGVAPEDNGNHLDPDDFPNDLTFESQWNSGFVFTRERQEYFLDFCQKVAAEPFHLFTRTCFASEMSAWLRTLRDSSDACIAHETLAQRHGWVQGEPYNLCCNVSLPTDNPSTFDTCLKRWANEAAAYPTDSDYFGVKFDGHGNVKVATTEIVMKNSFSFQFDSMDEVHQNVTQFMRKWSGERQPDGLRDGWASTFLRFYDLQKNIFDGTLTAMGVSLCLAFIVLFVMTFNVVVSFYAIVSIGFVLVTTVGTIVLLGWELNVLESVTVSIAVGLAVDFTVHFGVAYRLCPKPSRRDRTLYATRQMGPAITMAALTTFAAGVMMMPASILTFFQAGVFLMLIMSFSWLYANFFFLPLCATIGPQGRFGQVPIPHYLDCYGASQDSDDVLHEERRRESTSHFAVAEPAVKLISYKVITDGKKVEIKVFDFGEGCIV